MANKSIQLRILTVEEVRFVMNPGNLTDGTDPEKIQIGFTAQINPDIKNDTFTLLFGARYELEGDVLLESVYKFVFGVKDLKDFIIVNDDNTITVNNLMPHLFSVAVGTMRGILVVKTAGTSLSKYPLPIIDPGKLSAILSSTKKQQ